MNLRRYWEANFLTMELALAIVLSLLFSIWSETVNAGSFIYAVFTGNRVPLYGALVALFGSLLGFSITAVSIVLGYANSEKLEIVRNSDHYQDLWNTFKSAIKVLAFATITSLIGLILDRDTLPNNLILYINIFAAFLSFLRIGRCIWVLENIIAIVTKPRKRQD